MKANYQLPNLNGEQGNAFAILALVRKALEENGMKHLIKGYLERATARDYATLIGESYITLDMLNNKIERNEKRNK